jgi:tripartite-type tricarboxylate transporter receptor subunit TctC
MKRSILFCAGLAALIAAPLIALGQPDYPSHPVKIVVPVAAGGAPDVVARVLADRLSSSWHQPVIVEDRPGAGERIGAEAVAKAAPDGYTLLVTPPGPLVTSQFLYAKLPFDPSAFVPVAVLTTGHLVLITSASSRLATLQEVIAFAKANPGKLTYGSPGTGTLPHLTGEMLKAASGIQTTHVPYKGLAPALVDLLAGRVDVMFDNLGNSLRAIREGRAKALAVVSPARIAELPEVPTVSETYPEVLSVSWFGMVAPPGTPLSLARRISAVVAEALRQPEVSQKLKQMSFTPVGSTPEAMAAFTRREVERWRKVVASAGIRLE